MSSESTNQLAVKTRPAGGGGPQEAPAGLRLLDAALLIAFLGLTFLLGAFPMKDTDFWWHLRTGDLIRQNGVFPSTDWYTYGAPDAAWVDLHWLFQVGISWLHERGGVPALTLAKCAITTVSVLLLVTSKRREWPLWAAVAAWLPAILVLGGRMYVRPETLTLLYMSIFIAVLARIDRRPALALALPLVQVIWVNSQGLFVFGPALLGFALLDAATRPGAFSPARRRWWRVVLASAFFTGLACLVNPYGIRGALYPLQIASTMANPVFSRSIAELTPIPLFIQRDGLRNFSLRLQLLTMFVGAASFLLPIAWLALTRLRPSPSALPATKELSKTTKSVKPRKRQKAVAVESAPPYWRLSLFRLLLFVTFSGLSWQATRNSHQFAAVVGTISAWNFAEWAAGLKRRAREFGGEAAEPSGRGFLPRLTVLGAVVAVFGWVASGTYYRTTGEGRVVGLGEEPLWYPKEAIAFCGTEGMPPRFVGFHIGHASLYDYAFGPDRKSWVDARLEVIGPELYERYSNLQGLLSRYVSLRRPDPEGVAQWRRELAELGHPVVLADHANSTADTTALLLSPDWKCVWFDPVAAVFVHASYKDVVGRHEADFARRHFESSPEFRPKGPAALLASAKALRDIVWSAAVVNPAKSFPLVLLGLNHARGALAADPNDWNAWKMIGQLEMFREPMGPPVARFRQPFDPVFDLSTLRATYAMKRASELNPTDFSTLLTLESLFEAREMNEAALPLVDRILELRPINGEQERNQEAFASKRALLVEAMGPPPPTNWSNLSELGKIVGGMLATGRAESAAVLLESANPAGALPWDEADRIATLWLHLGTPAKARAVWSAASPPNDPALLASRVAATLLIEGDIAGARKRYQEAVDLNPRSFESLYGLAVLEQDDGRAAPALNAARRAEAVSPTEVARNAARSMAAFLTTYATGPLAGGPAKP